MSPATFTVADAKRFYDRFGSRQDRQAFYEDRALEALVGSADFGAASRVLELGCGTGRLAERILRHQLPAKASYLGLDVSETMVHLAGERLSEWEERAVVSLYEGGLPLAVGKGSVDRFLTTYVLDLIDADELGRYLEEAHRVLAPGGLFCHSGIAPGEGFLTASVSSFWGLLHHLRPALVGGCRPVEIADRLDPDHWKVLVRAKVSQWAITSEVVVAQATATTPLSSPARGG